MSTALLELASDPASWLAFGTLTLLEIVLGVDNLIFVALVVARLPADKQVFARTLGLLLALAARLALLVSVVWMTRLARPLGSLGPWNFSIRDLVLLAGGLFLLYKSTEELLEAGRAMRSQRAGEGGSDAAPPGTRGATARMVIVQIVLIDLVFSLDSVFTAVGLAKPDQVLIMAAAIVVAIVFMMTLTGPAIRLLEAHPRWKMLALAFLLLVAVSLLGDALHHPLDHRYLYGALFAGVIVEIAMTLRRSRS